MGVGDLERGAAERLHEVDGRAADRIQQHFVGKQAKPDGGSIVTNCCRASAGLRPKWTIVQRGGEGEER